MTDMTIRQVVLTYRGSNKKEVYRLLEDIDTLKMYINMNMYNKTLEEMNNIIAFYRDRHYVKSWCIKGKNINFDEKFSTRLIELINKLISYLDEEYMTCDETKNKFIKILDEICNELLEMELMSMDEEDFKYD